MNRAGVHAAICIHLNSTATREQQEKLATEYCIQHRIEPTSLVFHPSDALKLVADGLVDTIVVAYLPDDRAGLADEVASAGGVLREARHRRRAVPANLVKIFIRLAEQGLSVAEISAITDESTGEIRAELLRHRRRAT